MIVTELYNGQGLGNQLWSYVFARVLASDKGLEFGIMSPEKFKGKEFMSLDFGRQVYGGSGPEGGPPASLPESIVNYYVEKDVWHPEYKCDIRDYDAGLLNIGDNSKIEGLFQSERFIAHRKREIREWLAVKKEYDCRDLSKDNVCVLNVRGGEYKGTPELILERRYWLNAVTNMLRVNPKLEFIVITDDVKYAGQLLPQYRAFHYNIGKDYSIINTARYLVLSNSSFAFFPAWTSEAVKFVIAPKYWARHNVSDGYWACAFNLYQGWKWQDRAGKLFSFDECSREYSSYKLACHLDSFGPRPLGMTLSRFERLRRNVLRLKMRAALWLHYRWYVIANRTLRFGSAK